MNWCVYTAASRSGKTIPGITLPSWRHSETTDRRVRAKVWTPARRSPVAVPTFTVEGSLFGPLEAATGCVGEHVIEAREVEFKVRDGDSGVV